MSQGTEKKLGSVRIRTDVVKQYAATEAMECFGIVGMGALSLRDGFAKILKNEKITRGVEVSVKGDRVSISFHVIVAYGVNIKAVADNLMQNVIYKVESFTGLKVSEVNVYVEGVRLVD